MQPLIKLPTEGFAVDIKKAGTEDLAGVMHVNSVCLPENYSYEFFETLLKQFPESFLIAEKDNTVVGYTMCRIERILSKLERFRIRKAGHIISIAVLPDVRRRSIGTILMQSAEKALKDNYGCNESYLEVRVTNSPAIEMYKVLGYRILETLSSYYMDGEDAHLMAREL